MSILNSVKLALRRTGTSAFDTDIAELIEAAKNDLRIAGVNVDNEDDPLITMAIKTYCKAHFGETDEFINLSDSYETQKAQLMVASGFTNYDVYGISSVEDERSAADV